MFSCPQSNLSSQRVKNLILFALIKRQSLEKLSADQNIDNSAKPFLRIVFRGPRL